MFIHHQAQGTVYTMGDNSYGKLGIGNTQLACTHKPQELGELSKHKPAKISCGQNHTALLTENGEAFLWGKGNSGQLGYGGKNHQYAPIFIDYFRENCIFVKRVSCGGEHTAFLSFEGNLYTCGAGNQGQLGNGSTESLYAPKHIGVKEKLMEVSCGIAHTLALSTTNAIYAFGGNQFGQLGLGNKSASLVPIRIPLEKCFVKISTCMASCSSTEDGEIYVWGSIMGSIYLTPTRVYSGMQCKDISMGSDFIIALDSHGIMWGWGSNAFGELGQSDFNSRLKPTKIFALEDAMISSISAGSTYGVAIGQQSIAIDQSKFQQKGENIEAKPTMHFQIEEYQQIIRKLEISIIKLQQTISKNESEYSVVQAQKESISAAYAAKDNELKEMAYKFDK